MRYVITATCSVERRVINVGAATITLDRIEELVREGFVIAAVSDDEGHEVTTPDLMRAYEAEQGIKRPEPSAWGSLKPR